MTFFKISSIFAVLTLLATQIAFAHEEKAGDLVIKHPVAKATLEGAPVSAGYMTIKNTGSEDDVLMGGTAEFAGKVEIHTMEVSDGVMKMRPLSDGLIIPAGEEVKLKPGGLHVMFMQLTGQLLEDEVYDGTLTFKNAGDVKVSFVVENMMKKKMNHDMKEMKHDHNHEHDDHKHDH